MKRCSWCGKANEEVSLRCVECGTEFKADGVDRGFERFNPQLPFPMARLAMAFCLVAGYYFVVPLAMVGIASSARMLKIPLNLLPHGASGVLISFVYLVAFFLLLPASFYFIAFLPLVMKEDDVAVRKAWWNSAVGRSFWLAFMTPIVVILLGVLVMNIIKIFS